MMNRLNFYNRSIIENRLKKLNDIQRITFGICCCERLLPNYKKFKNDTNWGDENPLKKAMISVWNFVRISQLAFDVESLLKECEAVAPESENFQSEYTSYAQDAVFAVCSILDYLKSKDIERISQASSYAIDTVDLYVQEIENMSSTDPDLEEKIKLHPIMQKEIFNQFSDLEFLENGGNVLELERKWHTQSISNIGL